MGFAACVNIMNKSDSRIDTAVCAIIVVCDNRVTIQRFQISGNSANIVSTCVDFPVKELFRMLPELFADKLSPPKSFPQH